MVRTAHRSLLAKIPDWPHTCHKSCNHLQLKVSVLVLVELVLQVVLVPDSLELMILQTHARSWASCNHHL